MARAPDSKYQNPNPGYRKGDPHSGGGGLSGAGGKKRRPMEGWEKGDVRRDEDYHHPRDKAPKPKPRHKHELIE